MAFDVCVCYGPRDSELGHEVTGAMQQQAVTFLATAGS